MDIAMIAGLALFLYLAIGIWSIIPDLQFYDLNMPNLVLLSQRVVTWPLNLSSMLSYGTSYRVMNDGSGFDREEYHQKWLGDSGGE